MGGDCSQKLLLRRGWHSSPGRSRSSDQYAIHNSIAKMGSLRTRLSGVRFSPPAAARLSAFPEISFPEPVLFPTAGRSVSSLFETSSTAAGVQSPPPNIGGVVPAGPPKWLPFPPPLTTTLYNVVDPFVGPTDFDCFYTNPPWGASNEGESVKVFVQRGMEATSHSGEGMVVIADDPERPWTQKVLANVQTFAISSGFYVQRMQAQLHQYHLDDAPDLRSCNLVLRALPGNARVEKSAPIGPDQLNNFYGRENRVVPRYVREKKRVDYGKAHDDEYAIETVEREVDA